MLALTGQVASQVMGPGAFQEIDLASAFEAVASWSRTVHADSNTRSWPTWRCDTPSSSGT